MRAKKLLAVAGIAGVLAVTGVFGTLAYFSDTEVATNEFTVAGGEHTTGVDMDLTETKWSKDNETESGKVIEDWNKAAQDEKAGLAQDFSYGKDKAASLVPGDTINKNPQVTIRKGNAPCYARMTVTMPTDLYDKSSLKSNNNKVIYDFGKINSNWTLNTGVTVKDVADGYTVLVYDYNKGQAISAQDSNTPLGELFSQIKVTGDKVTRKDLEIPTPTQDAEGTNNTFNVVVNAYTVQAENFDSADAAFKAAFSDTFVQ